jgi:phosphoglycerate dehydrogenase-like enzyme
MTLHTLAILDDYAGIAPKYFRHIQDLKVDSFPDTIAPNSPENIQALADRLGNYTIISSMRERTPFTKDLLAALPNLKLLITTAKRNRGIDMVAARELGIVVSTAPGTRQITHPELPLLVAPSPEYDATTQHCFALILALASRIPIEDAALRSGGSFQTGLGFTLSNKIYGAVGLGRLGSNAARTAVLGFGMKVISWSANLTQEKADEAAENVGLPKGSIRAVTKEELLQTADVVSMHYVLSDRSRGIIGASELALMKQNAVLVNSSRGPLVDEKALLDTLNRGAIRGAALDVFDVEPLPLDSPWRTTSWGQDGRSIVVLSPHMGYVNDETMHKFYAEQADSIQRYIEGGIEAVPDVLN